MGWRARVSNGVHRHFRRPRERVEVSVHRLRERGWCFLDTLHYRSNTRGETILLSGKSSGPVHQQIVR